MAEPLISELIEDDPDLEGMVAHFVDNLPGMIADLELLHARADWLTLKHRVHDLKGLGGGYGYPQISEEARRLEADIRNAKHEQIPDRLESLYRLLDRIQLGLASNRP